MVITHILTTKSLYLVKGEYFLCILFNSVVWVRTEEIGVEEISNENFLYDSINKNKLRIDIPFHLKVSNNGEKWAGILEKKKKKKKVGMWTFPWKIAINSCCPNICLRCLDTCLKNNSVKTSDCCLNSFTVGICDKIFILLHLGEFL